MTVVQQVPTGPVPVPCVPAGPTVLLENISWETYERILAEHGDRRLRHTYDHGQLELMTISNDHGLYGYLLGALILALAEELKLRIKGGDPVTCRRQEFQRGLEPDKCFFIQSAPLILNRRQLDPARQILPDLALEIDISRSSLNRMTVYAALGIPEVWSFDGQTLQAYRLGARGAYEACEQSVAFPFLTVRDLTHLLLQGDTEDDATVLRAFRAWVRERLLPTWQGAPQDA